MTLKECVRPLGRSCGVPHVAPFAGTVGTTPGRPPSARAEFGHSEIALRKTRALALVLSCLICPQSGHGCVHLLHTCSIEATLQSVSRGVNLRTHQRTGHGRELCVRSRSRPGCSPPRAPTIVLGRAIVILKCQNVRYLTSTHNKEGRGARG